MGDFYIGIDGCRGGWLCSILKETGKLEIKLLRFLKDGIELLINSRVVSIDMPMGLVSKEGEKRICDNLIRKELGHPFSSTVFNVPCRQAVYAENYGEANRLNKTIQGKGLSVQTWNIVPKIKELDVLLMENIDLRGLLKEGHPELCFKNLKGNTLTHKKKTKEGINERISLLQKVYPNILDQFKQIRNSFFKKDVADDDILDSIVLAFNARGIFNTDYTMFPKLQVFDDKGIGMNVALAKANFYMLTKNKL